MARIRWIYISRLMKNMSPDVAPYG